VSYLLDTNAVIALLRGVAPVARKARFVGSGGLLLSTIVRHELYFGAYGSDQTNETLRRIDGLALEVVAFDDVDARVAAELRSILKRAGTPIGPLDTLIAGQALARDLTLVTRNTREFLRVPDLRVENWEA
jgi:tRNA(fMet)-specific endonuclease VapC